MKTKKTQRRSQQQLVRRDRNGLTRCRVCGCTELDACNPPCGWQAGHEDLCTTCHAAAEAIHEWMWAARRANSALTEALPFIFAALKCEEMAAKFDGRAERATEEDHQSGQYGNWCHDSEILKMAAVIFRREMTVQPYQKRMLTALLDPDITRISFYPP